MAEHKRATIGCDPEFFMKCKETDQVISAVERFPGSKHEPHTMKSGAGLQTDNVAIEFASAPAEDGMALITHLRETFEELIDEYMPENHSLFLSPSNVFNEKELKSDQAQQFGCSPSYDAWNLVENPQPCAKDSALRSIGAHIHLGAVEGDGNEFLLDAMGKVFTVRALDCTLGLIDIIMDGSPEAVARRELYGKASEHRPKDYGVEYRSLGPWWLSRPQTVMLVDSVAQDALAVVRDGKLDELVEKLGGKDKITGIINTGDRGEALSLVNEIVANYLSEDSKAFLEDCVKLGALRELSKEWFV